MKEKLFTLCWFSFIVSRVFSQCAVGESEVTIAVTTDDYGFENYWELLPIGNSCGVGTLFAGGNTAVGCNGGGLQNVSSGGYASNTTINEGPWCFAQGTNLQIYFTDDWGDGGTSYTINIDGFPVYGEQTGDGSPFNSIAFTVSPPLAYDAELHTISTYDYVNIGNVSIGGSVHNNSSNTFTSIEVNYQINAGSIVTATITGLNIPPFTEYTFEHPVPWNATANGDYDLKVWITNLNGNADMNMVNNTLEKVVTVGPGIPNIIDDYIGITPQKTIIATSADGISVPRDLDFHPTLTNNELWVILKSTENAGGQTVKISNAGEAVQTELLQQDENAYHFMSLPTAIAFSENGNFATSPGVYDANHDGGTPFTGPTLWSSDPMIYAQPSPGNGSHLDMLHESPYCMGIAYESDNVFWVNDGDHNSIVRYDFKEDHGPGMHDHSDGNVRRYNGLGIVEDPTHHVPSHLVLDKPTGMLYIVDSENDRVLRLDINTGAATGTFTPIEGIDEASVYTGFTSSVYIGSGLTQPCGIDIVGDRLIVSDYVTGEIIIYNCSGSSAVELSRIQTNTPGVMGVKIGPDGKIWYVNATTNQVVRLEPINVIGLDENVANDVNIFPNPTSDHVQLTFANNNYINGKMVVKNVSGQEVLVQKITLTTEKIDVQSFPKGVYFITLEGTKASITKKVIVD